MDDALLDLRIRKNSFNRVRKTVRPFIFAYRAMKIYDSSKVQWIGTSQIRKEHYEKRDEWFEKMG